MPNIDLMQFAGTPINLETLDYQALILGVLALYGLVTLLFGYRLWKIYIFLIGFGVGAVIASMFKDTGPLMIIGCGLASGLLSIVLWYVSIFLIGFALGAGLLLLVGVTIWPILLVVGIVCGVLAVLIRKFIIIVSTSFSGAEALVFVAFALSGIKDIKLQLLSTVILAIVGIVCQYTITSGKKRLPPVKTIESPVAATDPQPAAES